MTHTARLIEAVREDAADAHAEMGNEVMRRLRQEQERAHECRSGSKQAEISAIDVSIAREEVAQRSIYCGCLEPEALLGKS